MADDYLDYIFGREYMRQFKRMSVPDKIEPPEPPDRSRYDIRAEVAAIEARIRARSLAYVTVTKDDERFLASVGMRWDE